MQASQISCQLCSNMDIRDSWAHQVLQRANKNFKWPIKFGNLHVFEWDMGHWPILKKYALRILSFYVNFGILSFDRWNGMFPNRPVHVHIFIT